jgi:hypothetical protein
MLREYKARGGTDVRQGFILEGRETVYRKWCKKASLYHTKKTNQPFQTFQQDYYSGDETSSWKEAKGARARGE